MTNDERKKLIERLRSNQCKLEDCGQCKRDTMVADELTRLTAENADLTALNDKLCEEIIVLKLENAELRAENQQIKAEVKRKSDWRNGVAASRLT